MVTLDVVSLYGTNMVRDPSFPRSPELRLSSRRPCSFSFFRVFHQPSAPYPLPTMESVRRSAATNLVLLDVDFARIRKLSTYFRIRIDKGSSLCRRVDWAAMAGTHTVAGVHQNGLPIVPLVVFMAIRVLSCMCCVHQDTAHISTQHGLAVVDDHSRSYLVWFYGRVTSACGHSHVHMSEVQRE